MDPRTAFLDGDQTDTAQVGQVARGGRLGHAEHLDEVVHAQGALAEQMEDAKAGAVGEGPKNGIGDNLG